MLFRSFVAPVYEAEKFLFSFLRGEFCSSWFFVGLANLSHPFPLTRPQNSAPRNLFCHGFPTANLQNRKLLRKPENYRKYLIDSLREALSWRDRGIGSVRG